MAIELMVSTALPVMESSHCIHYFGMFRKQQEFVKKIYYIVF